MSNVAIRVHNLSKRYRIGRKEEVHETLAGALVAYLRRPTRNLRRLRHLTRFSENGQKPEDVIWALKDVSFEVTRGEVVGIIGRNGAGKSTLLKILSRITHPTSGRVELNGRVSSLLEVGTGFHPELTGRENIYLNGTILGMRKSEIDRKFDEIVDFSGVEKFIDTPVKRHSSGMRVRLAFSVAAHLEPEILMIDEVLAVGDAEFQQKCLGKVEEVASRGRTVLFVSHNMAAIRNLCKRTLLIESGTLLHDGPTESIVVNYLDGNLQAGATIAGESLDVMLERFASTEVPSIRFIRIEILDDQGIPSDRFQSDETIRISVTYQCLISVTDLRVVIQIVDEENSPILVTQNVDVTDPLKFHRQQPGIHRAECLLPPNTFGQRRFYVTLHLINPKHEHLTLNKILTFKVDFRAYNNIQYGSWSNAFLRPRLCWSVNPVADECLELDNGR